MKIKSYFYSTLLICLLGLSTHGAQESIEGHWQGALVRDGAVQVIMVEFFKDAQALKASIEIPDLVIAEPAIVAVNLENGKARFDTAAGKATVTIDFEMGEMVGIVGEATPPIRIHLKRAFKPVQIPVRMEDVTFRSGDVTLSGTLVTPSLSTKPGPYPAVVWIHGRGKSARNGFRGFARILAQRGIASLIYDKRGVGASTGDHDKANVYDFAADAMAALEFLATRSEIDRKQIGLHATSAGGWSAAIVANRTKIPLAFIVTNVGPAESVRDQQIHVAKYSMRQSGIDFTPEEYAAAAEHMRLVEDFAYTGKGWEALRSSVVKARPTRWASFVDLPESESYEDIVWVHLNQYDPGPDLKRIAVPFLALYGGSDYVVPPEDNVKKLERYLTEAGNTDFKIVIFPGADHGLSISSQLRRPASEHPETYYWLWRKRAPGMVETTVDWLLQHVNSKRSD
jgi:alpha-beta hydrolase superfamily lysophospholipase